MNIRSVTPGRSTPAPPPGAVATNVLRQTSAPAWQYQSPAAARRPETGSCRWKMTTGSLNTPANEIPNSQQNGGPLLSHVSVQTTQLPLGLTPSSPPLPPRGLSTGNIPSPSPPPPEVLVSPQPSIVASSSGRFPIVSGQLRHMPSSGSLHRAASAGPATLQRMASASMAMEQSTMQRTASGYLCSQVMRLPSAPSLSGAAVESASSPVHIMTTQQQQFPPQPVRSPQTGRVFLRGSAALRTANRSTQSRSPLELDVFDIETIHFEGRCFDPTTEPLKMQLLSRLEGLGIVPSSCAIEVLRNAGGFNEGMWLLHSQSHLGTLVLKLVKTHRRHPMLPTDAENFISIIQRRPNIINDHAVTFPIKIFHCVGPGENWSHDLIVMRKAAGRGFDATVAQKCSLGQVDSLMQDLDSLGCFLAKIHTVYGMQHGDLQPSNVFYEEANGWFSVVDCGGMGPQPYANDDDLQHLIRGICLITPYMGEDFKAEVRRHLKTSYFREMDRLRHENESHN